ncbi:MAG: Re/Si-specific NAD(P)(+) transhydrogenase subunit alpha [Methylophilaceae bacterium]|jgi:NAD(P) transhydrogenase subunit alpha|nr:Re/Si-specific NAD(P)(+) transhydrogenase subunit alpha [Methylophilaceae bacterium]MBL6728071.1 Re/Si-specific NAD(P)(+) transhydrogenase subunit alpha [Methylophilaceae bacterium]MBL6790477.1 Re/Si-specific NAD(P)(+) transhydrogenase subunit alpha [Methylophilaceae bacterium]
MIIGILKETKSNESRVAASLETAKKLIGLNHKVIVESGAGILSFIQDADYQNLGVKIVSRQEVFDAEIILVVNAPSAVDIENLKPNQILIGMLEPFNKQLTTQLAEKKITAFALEALPRNTRAQTMDILSSQANIAGYKAVILAANTYKKFIPMLMTAAGTVKAARVMILGAGVAGLQAIATAKRLGAIVEASDVRPSVKEQIESLGAKFIDVPYETDEEKAAALGEGGYAKAMPRSWLSRQATLVAEKAEQADIIITSALIPGKEPPILINEDTVKKMKQGSVIVDMAAGQALNGSGNCPLTKADEIVYINGVTIIGTTNLASELSADATSLYARNVFEFVKLLFDENNDLKINMDDELLAGSLLTMDGQTIK